MQPVERPNLDGVNYVWVTQVTLVMTILVGPPIVAVLSMDAGSQTWGTRAEFTIRVGAVVWLVTVVVLFVYAKRTNACNGGTSPEAELDTDIDMED